VYAGTAALDDEVDMGKIRLHLREVGTLALVGCPRCKGRLVLYSRPGKGRPCAFP
jgi:hypothetical protein